MINETGSARSAIREAACVVDAELSYLYNRRRDDEDTINCLKSKIKIMCEESEVIESKLKTANRIARESILVMYCACVAAFIAIGYVVLVLA